MGSCDALYLLLLAIIIWLPFIAYQSPFYAWSLRSESFIIVFLVLSKEVWLLAHISIIVLNTLEYGIWFMSLFLYFSNQIVSSLKIKNIICLSSSLCLLERNLVCKSCSISVYWPFDEWHHKEGNLMGTYITKLLLCPSHSARGFTPIMYSFSQDLFLVGITQNLQRRKWVQRD